MNRLQKYFYLYRLAVFHSIKNYKALIGLSIFLMTCMLIFAHLWKIAAMRMGVFHLQQDQLLWYIALNEWVLISLPDVQEEIEQDLRSGRLAYLLPRPISYLTSIFCESLGTLSVNLFVLGIVAFSFTSLFAGTIPFTLVGMGIVILSALLAGCVAMLFQMVVGLSAFWLKDSGPFYWIWEKSLFALGGLMLPLAIYPEWLQLIAKWTPFPSILGERSVLALDFSFSHAFLNMGHLLLWGSVAFYALFYLYRRGQKILNMEGG